MERYIGFGTDHFAGAPLVLPTPATGDLKTALAPLGKTSAAAYRALSGVSVTVTDTNGKTATWTHQAGEGYAFPLADIVCSGGNVLVFY